MRRNTSLVMGVLVIVVLAGVMMTSIGSTTERISPQELADGDYQGQTVQVEGMVSTSVELTDSEIRFSVAGDRSMANASKDQDLDIENATSIPVVWKDYPNDAPTNSLVKGTWVRVTGTYDGEVLKAEKMIVDAHGN